MGGSDSLLAAARARGATLGEEVMLTLEMSVVTVLVAEPLRSIGLCMAQGQWVRLPARR